jgi:tRNA/rRNA methyltransferase
MNWQDNLRIVLVHSRNSLNMGAAARAMYNFGFSKLWLVAPYDEAFHDARSAVGAAEVLRKARVVPTLAEALGGASMIVGTSSASGRSSPHVQRMLPDASHMIRTHLEKSQAALVFGSEKFGLSNDDLSHCDWIVSIPTKEKCPSMNLGQSVAVCCYEIARQAKVIPELQTPAKASAAQRERLVGLLEDVLESSGFLKDDARKSQMLKIRRWAGRLRLAPADARLFQGMLRQIDWKLRRK